MHYIDITVLFIMGMFAVMGFKRGFITEIFQIIGLFAAIALNTPVSRLINNYAKNIFDTHSEIIGLFSGITAFIFVFAFFFIMGIILTKTTNIILTSIPNRIIGGIFGGIKGFMVATVVLLLIRLIPAGDEFIQRNVIPDRDTDKLIESSVDMAVKITNKHEIALAMKDSLIGINLDYSKTTDSDSPAYSRLGYGAYKISTLMDPFIGSVKKLFTDTVEDAKDKLDL